MYSFVYVRGHVEVYQYGEFILSADTKSEALKELALLED
jgi:hypothetical protein